MTQYALPAVYALLVWWFGTGLALYIVGLPGATHRWSLLGAALVFAGSLYGLAHVATIESTLAVYAAFTLAILLWGAIEISFLTGIVTGPMRGACPDGCAPWLRASYAFGAILWHELLLAAAGIAITISAWGAPNKIGVWTFALLWAMRLSAKLNLFLGVPVLNDHFLPAPVAHLKSYFRKGPVSALFPVSVTLGTLLTLLLAEGSLLSWLVAAEGLMLLAALCALAVLEHWFMVLPLPLERLWRWSVPAVDVDRARTPALVRAAAGERTQAFEIWTAPVVNLRDDSAETAPDSAATNVLPYPALSRQRRRP